MRALSATRAGVSPLPQPGCRIEWRAIRERRKAQRLGVEPEGEKVIRGTHDKTQDQRNSAHKNGREEITDEPAVGSSHNRIGALLRQNTKQHPLLPVQSGQLVFSDVLSVLHVLEADLQASTTSKRF